MQQGPRLTGCESWVRWAYFQEKYHNSQKYAQPFEELLMFIAHGHIFEKLLYFSGLLEMQAHSKGFCTGVTWVSDMYGCMYNNARLGGSGGMLPHEFFLEIICSEIASEAIWDRSRAVVAVYATWLAECCIQFLNVHVCIC